MIQCKCSTLSGEKVATRSHCPVVCPIVYPRIAVLEFIKSLLIGLSAFGWKETQTRLYLLAESRLGKNRQPLDLVYAGVYRESLLLKPHVKNRSYDISRLVTKSRVNTVSLSGLLASAITFRGKNSDKYI